jgi:hypothetical protein
MFLFRKNDKDDKRESDDRIEEVISSADEN